MRTRASLSVMQSPAFLLQLAILTASLFAIALQAWNFPYPSPLVQPLLEPRQRWPEDQVKAWVESGVYDPGFVRFFMRDPERTVPAGDNLVSPADGVVKEIAEFGDKKYFVVGLSFWDVHVVRTPVAGTVTSVDEEGEAIFRDVSETSQLAYIREKASPVQKTVTVRSDDGSSYKVRLITSWWASRIKVSARIGQRLTKGQRIGRILLGSSVVIDAPAAAAFQTPVGSRVVAGETIIWKR